MLNSKKNSYFYYPFNFLLLVILVSCSSPKPAGKTEAESLYLEANQLIEKKRYIAAIEKLNQLKTQHPYSYYTVPSELRLADVYFMQENFEESATAYLMFRDLHPKHEKLDYVIYKIAESYDKQTPSTHDRDLSSAQEAIKYYQELLGKYATSPYIEPSKQRIEVIKDKLLKKEKYIADFYFKTKNYEAALWRYKFIQETLQDKDLLSHAKFREVLTLEKLSMFKECLDTIKAHASFFSDEQLKEMDAVADRCAASWKEKANQ